MNTTRIWVAAAAAATAIWTAPLQAATDPSVRQWGSIPYATGGVSEEGRDNLRAIARDFNLKLVLATKSGAYLSDVGVVVSDARGQQVLAAKSDGPWFFAKLPPGHYNIEASSNGNVVRRDVDVGTQGIKEVDFRWND
jgi:hypothetical protein